MFPEITSARYCAYPRDIGVTSGWGGAHRELDGEANSQPIRLVRRKTINVDAFVIIFTPLSAFSDVRKRTRAQLSRCGELSLLKTWD